MIPVNVLVSMTQYLLRGVLLDKLKTKGTPPQSPPPPPPTTTTTTTTTTTSTTKCLLFARDYLLFPKVIIIV